MHALDAHDASAGRVIELVGRVRPEQRSNPTPCSSWNVETLVGHLIATMEGYCALLRGAPAAQLLSLLERQSEAGRTDPVMACKAAAQSVCAAFAEPGALERIVHHPIGDIPGSRLLAMRTTDNVVHSWDLATAIGEDPRLDERLVEVVYEYLAPRAQSGAMYATGLFSPPTKPLPEGATRQEQLLHLVGR
jgi:uncharacterized protein (TIGR03086 family)